VRRYSLARLYESQLERTRALFAGGLFGPAVRQPLEAHDVLAQRDRISGIKK